MTMMLAHKLVRRCSRAALVTVVLGTSAGCDDPCSDLQEICDSCPAEGDGPIAKSSCEKTVREGTEEDCEERVELETYQPFGCHD
jgi:hypothetical protein